MVLFAKLSKYPEYHMILRVLLVSTILLFIGYCSFWVLGEYLIGCFFKLDIFPNLKNSLLKKYSVDLQMNSYFVNEVKFLILRTIGIFMLYFGVGAIYFGFYPQIIHKFWHRTESSLRLGIFRIVVFMAILILSIHLYPEAIHYSTYPKSLQIPPPFLSEVLKILPINKWCIDISFGLIVVGCTFVIIGYKTRLSAIIVCIFAWYLLGIPQFYGQLNHYHHLLWFAIILTFSPLDHAISIDNWKKNKTLWAGENIIYARVINYIWICFAIIYLFPGIWKFLIIGLDWNFSDNLRNMTWHVQMLYNTPPPILVGYDYIYKFGATIALLFELLFIFLIFKPKSRLVAMVVGLAFHNLTWHFLNISFWTLQICYVVFIPMVFSNKSVVQIPDIYWKEWIPKWIIGLNVLCAFFLIDTWIFTIYPTFAGYNGTTKQTIEMVVSQDAPKLLLKERILWENPKEAIRFNMMLTKILKMDKKEQKQKLTALFKVWKDKTGFVKNNVRVTFNEVELDVNPQQKLKVLNRRQIYSFKN